jgi:hypothetical protein
MTITLVSGKFSKHVVILIRYRFDSKIRGRSFIFIIFPAKYRLIAEATRSLTALIVNLLDQMKPT